MKISIKYLSKKSLDFKNIILIVRFEVDNYIIQDIT